MRILISILLFLSSSLGMLAQSKISPTLQHQIAKQNVLRSDAKQLFFDAYIYITDTSVLNALETLDVKIGVQTAHFVTARIPLASISEVASLPSVRYIDGAVSVKPMLDKARAASRVDDVLSGKDLTMPYTGKGVIVGVVDAGFDYCHPAFRNDDASTLRIVRVWEQSYEQGTPPDGYSYGGELTTSEQILSAMGDVTTNSHGTHVAAIAAGRDCGNNWGGVAPEAEIVLVSKGAQTTNNVNITDAVAYIFNYAKSQQKPCVVNLSLGMQTGPHDGTSPFDTMLDALQGEGCIVVGSAGNFGADPIHISAKNSEVTKTFIDYKQKVSSSTADGTIDIWGNVGGKYSVQLALVNVSSGEIVSSSEVLDASLSEGGTTTYTVTSSAKGSATITTEINPINNKPHALINLAFTSKKSSCEFALIITPLDETTEVHAWADDTYIEFASNNKEDYVAGDTNYTIAEIGGTGNRLISVGSYTTRANYTAMGSTSTNYLDEKIGEISSFSAAGPTLDGRTKPDVSAPGCFIISAVSSNDASLSSIPLAGSLTFDGTDYYWGYMQGTSMAAPFVTGTVASWLQANPQLSPESVREIITATAMLPSEGTNYSVSRWGVGKIQSYEGLKKVIETAAITSPTVSPNENIVWAKGQDGNLHILFTNSNTKTPIYLYDLLGRCVASTNASQTSCEVVLPTASLEKGTYILRVANQTKKIVW